MTHPLKSLDKDGVLPKKLPSLKGKGCNCEAWGYIECGCGADWSDNDTHNQAIDVIESIGIEFDVVMVAIKIWEFDRKGKNPSNKQIEEFIPLAKAIANSPEVLRLVRMKEEK